MALIARKPVGFAEVSLTFTDCADELDVDWHDVRATRRVYRDGNPNICSTKPPAGCAISRSLSPTPARRARRIQ